MWLAGTGLSLPSGGRILGPDVPTWKTAHAPGAALCTDRHRRPRVVGDVRLDAARVEVDQVLQLFYDPYSVEALPDVVSAERTVEGSGSAEEAGSVEHNL